MMMREWLRKMYMKIFKEKLKISLFLDSDGFHPNVIEVKNVKIIFSPFN